MGWLGKMRAAIKTLRWMRAIGDSIFGRGALAFVAFAASLLHRPSNKVLEARSRRRS